MARSFGYGRSPLTRILTISMGSLEDMPVLDPVQLAETVQDLAGAAARGASGNDAQLVALADIAQIARSARNAASMAATPSAAIVAPALRIAARSR